MGSANLDDVLPRICLGLYCCEQSAHLGQQSTLDLFHCRNMHGCGEGIVGTLRHVDVIIGMDGLLGANNTVRHLDGAIADYLVHVHVALRTAAGLPYVKRKVLVQRAGDHLIGTLDDEVGLVLRQPPGTRVHDGCSFFHVAIGVVHLQRHVVVADGEVDERSLRLRSP